MKNSAFLTNISPHSAFTRVMSRAMVVIDKLVAAGAQKVDERGNALIAARYKLRDGSDVLLVASDCGYELYRPMTIMESARALAPPQS